MCFHANCFFQNKFSAVNCLPYLPKYNKIFFSRCRFASTHTKGIPELTDRQSLSSLKNNNISPGQNFLKAMKENSLW